MARKRAFKPSFYKILIDFAVKLKLPRKFMEKYGAELPRNVKLRIGSGATWQVRVEKEKKRYLFTRGWTKFSRDMRLKQFECVVFAYAGNSTFDVTAYAKSAVEKPCG